LARHESLPLLHRPRRAAPPSQRAAALQREFEALGCYELSNFKSPPMQRRSRVHIQPESSGALDFAPGSGSISPVPMPPPPLTPPSFGSIVNVLELRVAEARVQRQQVDEANCGAASSERMLEAASRMNSEECLLALRQLAAVISPKLGPVLLRIADSLEPVLFSTAHRDIEGHRLTYEQVVKLVLSPRVADEAERGDDAEAGRERAWLQVQLGEAISTSLSRSLEEQQAQYRALEGRYQTLQAEATSARRAFQFELEAQVATSRLDHASEVDELKAQLTRARESITSLQRSEASLSATLEDAAPREELVAAQAAADAANAAQRAAAAGRIRAVIALARTQRRVERLEKEVAELRAAAAASVRHGKE